MVITIKWGLHTSWQGYSLVSSCCCPLLQKDRIRSYSSLMAAEHKVLGVTAGTCYSRCLQEVQSNPGKCCGILDPFFSWLVGKQITTTGCWWGLEGQCHLMWMVSERGSSHTYIPAMEYSAAGTVPVKFLCSQPSMHACMLSMHACMYAQQTIVPPCNGNP